MGQVFSLGAGFKWRMVFGRNLAEFVVGIKVLFAGLRGWLFACFQSLHGLVVSGQAKTNGVGDFFTAGLATSFAAQLVFGHFDLARRTPVAARAAIPLSQLVQN